MADTSKVSPIDHFFGKLRELQGLPYNQTRWERFCWKLQEAWEFVLKVEDAIWVVGEFLYRLAMASLILASIGGLCWLVWRAFQ
jgi:hypothetical protein